VVDVRRLGGRPHGPCERQDRRAREGAQEYAESHGCPAGQGSSNGCSRHGYALEVKAAFNALLGHQDVESAALALYNCSALERRMVSLCWLECGLPEHLLKIFHSASKPTMSKWQVFEGFVVDWFLPLCKPVRVMVGTTPKLVIPKACHPARPPSCSLGMA